jgi:hypothetical protein
MNRVTHVITSECEIRVIKLTPDIARVRFVEKDVSDPTDFEIEGSPAHIAEALLTAASVLINLDKILQEPS